VTRRPDLSGLLALTSSPDDVGDFHPLAVPATAKQATPGKTGG